MVAEAEEAGAVGRAESETTEAELVLVAIEEPEVGGGAMLASEVPGMMLMNILPESVAEAELASEVALAGG
jgi:hypothetical protein